MFHHGRGYIPMLSWAPFDGIGLLQKKRVNSRATPVKKSARATEATQRHVSHFRPADLGAVLAGSIISLLILNPRILAQIKIASSPAAIAKGNSSVTACEMDQLRGSCTRAGRTGTPSYQSLKAIERAPAE
jgi:hypothetical protein